MKKDNFEEIIHNELTEEDEAFLAIPGNEISYGSDTVKTTAMSSITFTYDGISYSIMNTSSDIHIDEMLEMTEELLSK